MSLLGAVEVSMLRTAAEATMPGTLTIYRRTLTSDGAGGQRGTIAPIGTVPCRAVPRRGEPSEQVRAGRIEARQDWYLYVPAGTDVVATTDHVVLAGGGTFDILGVHAARAYEPSRRIMATERR